MRTRKYGPAASQEGDLHLPENERAPVVCLLHGGFWRMPYGRDEFSAVAIDLVRRGFAVWNIEYRRVGEVGGGWPGTAHDVALAIDHLATLVAEGASLDLDRVSVVGHSAGGHLALCCAGRDLDGSSRPSRVRPAAVAGLAAVVDLVRTQAIGSGNNAVEAFLGGSPLTVADRYEAASPLRQLPLNARQLILHGTADEALPIDLTRDYVQAAKRAGGEVDYVELADSGHMEYLDPQSLAHAILCRWLATVSTPPVHASDLPA